MFMKPTTMTVCRVLLVCFFCALPCGVAISTPFFLLGVRENELSQRTMDATVLGQKAVDAQSLVSGSASGLLKLLEEALRKAKRAADGEERAKDALGAVEAAVTRATNARNRAVFVDTAVRGAQKMTADATDADDMDRKATDLEEAAEFWTDALQQAQSQLAEAEETLEEFKKARTASESKARELKDDPTEKKAKDALKQLTEDMRQIFEAEELVSYADAAEKAITKANGIIIWTAKEAKALAKVTGAPTLNVSNKNFSPDGSPLTVSGFAATSVLFLLARLAAGMITA